MNLQMKMPMLYLLLLGVIANLSSCISKHCKDLPTQFSNYQHAINIVKSTDFTIEDSVDTSKSSFIESASFYSCDSKTGFLFVKIRSTEYIHQNISIDVWESFKKADSFGRFYNRNVKGKYLLIINE